MRICHDLNMKSEYIMTTIETSRAHIIQNRKENADALRERFKRVVLHAPRNPAEIAKEIGVSTWVVECFIVGARKTFFKTLCKIEAWLMKEEQRLGL